MAETKPRLTRPRQGAWIAGVCAGIARRFGWRPLWVRVAYIAISIFPLFPGILVYVVLWVVIPREDGDAATASLQGGGPQPKEVHG